MPTDPRHSPHDVMVPLALLDRLMRDLAGVLHDGPVQALVAAKMMVESAASTSGEQPELLTRAVAALDRAAQQSRDAMWAMTRGWNASDLAEALADALSRAADPDTGLQIAIDLDGATLDAGMLRSLVAACQDVVVDVAAGGGSVRRVVCSEGEDGLALMVDTTTPTGDTAAGQRPWLQLARARLAPLGGTLEVDLAGADDPMSGRRTIWLRFPRSG